MEPTNTPASAPPTDTSWMFVFPSDDDDATAAAALLVLARECSRNGDPDATVLLTHAASHIMGNR